MKSPTEALLEAGDVGSTPAFKALMAQHKQREDLVAPGGLRGLLRSEALKRVRVTRGYHHYDGKAVLSWFLSEHSVQGSPDEVVAGLESYLSSLGMSHDPEGGRGPFSQAWTRKLGAVEEAVRFEPPSEAVGAPEPFSGGSLDWSLEGPASEPLSYGALIEAMPYFADSRIPEPIHRGLADVPVASLSLGGTWTRYYSLSVTFDAGAAITTEALTKVLTGSGFAVEEESATLIRLKRQETRSFAQIYAPDELGRIRLHIQPES